MAKHGKRHHISVASLGLFAVGLAAGLIIGATWLADWLDQYAPTSGIQTLSPSVVFSRIQEQDELVSASQDYTIVDKVSKQRRDLFDLFDVPFTQNSFWYRYTGTIKAGVNLATAEMTTDENNPTALHVTLDEPYIISDSPNYELTGVLEENNNVLNPISISEADAFQEQCEAEGEQQAIEGGLLDEAKQNAEDDLTKLFDAAFGDDVYTLDFTYRDATAESGAD